MNLQRRSVMVNKILKIKVLVVLVRMGVQSLRNLDGISDLERSPDSSKCG